MRMNLSKVLVDFCLSNYARTRSADRRASCALEPFLGISFVKCHRTLAAFLKYVAMGLLATRFIANGTEPTVQWATVAGSIYSDYAFGIALVPGGQLYLVGDFEQSLAADQFMRPGKVLYIFDRKGTFIGNQATRGENLRSVALDSQGNYYVTGQVWDSGRLGVG